MTQDTQVVAGAQPAPALQPEALRIAMHIRQRAPVPRPGNLDTLSAAAANELERQHAQLESQAAAKCLHPLTEDAAHALGAKGAAPTEAERLLFEAWMRGHCWALCAEWDGKGYRSAAEVNGEIDPHAMRTRQIFAAWRDRAALQAASPAPAAVAVPAEIDLPDVEDMAHSAVQEALSYGVNHDVFHRWMRAVMDKTVQALAAAPAQEHATQLAGQALPVDEFRGDTASLVRNIVALLDLDAQGCLVPHGVGGHARGLLSAAASRLAASDQAQGCTRSHPHENMSPMCVLRTEIARLNHAAAIAQVPAAPVAHPHHCTARSADGACEECEGHAQAMAEWRAEAAAPAQAQEDARDAELFRAMANAAITEDAAFGECLERLGGDCKTIDDIRAVFDAARAAQGGA